MPPGALAQFGVPDPVEQTAEPENPGPACRSLVLGRPSPVNFLRTYYLGTFLIRL